MEKAATAAASILAWLLQAEKKARHQAIHEEKAE